MPVSTFAIVVGCKWRYGRLRDRCGHHYGDSVEFDASLPGAVSGSRLNDDDRKCRYGHTRQGGPLQLWEHLWRTRRVPDPGDADLAQRPDHAAGTNRLVVRYAPVESDTHIGCRDRAN